MNAFTDRPVIVVPAPRSKRYRYVGLVPVERQRGTIDIISREKAQAATDRRDALKRSMP